MEDNPERSNERHSDQQNGEKPSKLWYLLPIFFSWIGGLIAYFLLKDRDPRMAKSLLVLGIVWAVVIIVLSIVSSFFLSSALEQAEKKKQEFLEKTLDGDLGVPEECLGGSIKFEDLYIDFTNISGVIKNTGSIDLEEVSLYVSCRTGGATTSGWSEPLCDTGDNITLCHDLPTSMWDQKISLSPGESVYFNGKIRACFPDYDFIRAMVSKCRNVVHELDGADVKSPFILGSGGCDIENYAYKFDLRNWVNYDINTDEIEVHVDGKSVSKELVSFDKTVVRSDDDVNVAIYGLELSEGDTHDYTLLINGKPYTITDSC